MAERAKTKPAEKKNFEASMTRLEEIVASLEAGNAPLAQSLSLFEEGVGLVKSCTAELDRAEQQIKILTRDESGAVVEADFVPPAEGDHT